MQFYINYILFFTEANSTQRSCRRFSFLSSYCSKRSLQLVSQGGNFRNNFFMYIGVLWPFSYSFKSGLLKPSLNAWITNFNHNIKKGIRQFSVWKFELLKNIVPERCVSTLYTFCLFIFVLLYMASFHHNSNVRKTTCVNLLRSTRFKKKSAERAGAITRFTLKIAKC